MLLPLVLADFRPAVMCPQFPQHQLLEYMAWVMASAQCAKRHVTSKAEANRIGVEIREQVYRYGVSADHIRQRQCSLLGHPEKRPDPGTALRELPELFKDIEENPQGAPLDQRMAFYDDLVSRFLRVRYAEADGAPDDIVHVTCAGYLSPSPVQKMVSELGWNETVVTHSYHMGCYGAFPAVRMVTGFLAASHVSVAKPKSRVDVLHTEALSIHFDVANVTPNNVVNMTLFGDGFISYSAFPEHDAHERGLRGLKILACQDRILPSSAEEMSWQLGPHQFDMFLSRDVPQRIRDALPSFIESLCAQVDIDLEAQKSGMIFAIHPGGPKILEHARERLKLDPTQTELSKQVLYENGNMSSATIPHVWEKIVSTDSIPVGTKVISVGFGPGLTTAGLLLEKV